MAFDSGRLEELKLSGALPSPSGVGLSILELTRCENYDIEDLTSKIQADPALTGRILKLANASTVASSERVANLNEAVMRLGVNVVRNLALGFSLVTNNRSGGCPEFDYDRYWSWSLANALLAQGFSATTGQASPADVFTCGLLSGIGRLALASIHPARYHRILSLSRSKSSSELVAIEQAQLNTDHNELGAALLEDWRLPPAFSFAVAKHEFRAELVQTLDATSRDMAAVVHVSAIAAELFLRVDGLSRTEWPLELEVLHELSEFLEIEAKRTGEIMDQAAQAWCEWGKSLYLPTHELPCMAEMMAEPRPSAAGSGPAKQAPRRRAGDVQDPSTEASLSASEDLSCERQGLRVLAVDDDPVSLRILVQHLRRDGHTVSQAHNGREALKVALSEAPQLIVTDWLMPEMDGLEFCKSLRLTPAGRGIYVLILTAREDDERIVEAFDAGADDYVVKPFNARILLARVRAGQRMIDLRERVELDRRERARQLAEMALLNRKLRAAALTDVLTELPNRRYAMKRLEQELARSQRAPAQLAVMMLDIDNFKAVNDCYGHDVGDHVLRETASVLRGMTRRGDVVCRLGGEEFLIISSNSDLDEARRSAERIRVAVERHEIDMGADRQTITVSIGVADLEGSINNVDELLKTADRRVYEAKRLGRNRVIASDVEGLEEPGDERRSA